MKRIFVIFLFIFIYSSVFAQIDDLSKQKNIFFQDEFTLGFALNTNGWSFDYRHGNFINLKQKNLWEVGYSTIKHPKEYKQSSYYKYFTTYVYGKMNEIYDFNFGIGRQFTIVDKREPGTVEIRIIPMIGVEAVLLKPIYYEIITSINPTLVTDYEKFNIAQQPGVIIGKGPYSKGFNEISFNYGIYLKLGTSFEHSKNVKAIRSLEAGIKIDYFAKNLEIMAKTPNYQLVTSLYLSYRLGSTLKTQNKKSKEGKIK